MGSSEFIVYGIFAYTNSYIKVKAIDVKKPHISAGLLYLLAPRPGLEPGTHGLTVSQPCVL